MIGEIKQDFKEKSTLASKFQTEIEKLNEELEKTTTELETKKEENTDLNEELKASKSALNWFKVDVEEKQKTITEKDEEINLKTNEIQEIENQISEKQSLLEEKTQIANQLQTELDTLVEQIQQKENENKIQNNEVFQKQEIIQQLQNEIENQKQEISHRTERLNKKEQQIHQLQNELKNRINDLQFRNKKLDEQKEIINKLQQEKNQLIFNFEQIKDAVPSSILMIDKNHNITSWNKKAQEMLGIDDENKSDISLSDLQIMKKQRMLEGFNQFKKDKKQVTVKSISIKDKKGDFFLTNVTQMPILDEKNELQGSILIVDDVSDRAEIQAELNRKQDELKQLDQQFQQVHTRLMLKDKEKIAFDNDIMKMKEEQGEELDNITGMLEKKQQELEVIDKNISLKNDELSNITTKLEENKNTLSFVESELARKKIELEMDEGMNQPGTAWKEKLKIYDEIDKSLDVVDNNLKTKKLKEESEK